MSDKLLLCQNLQATLKELSKTAHTSRNIFLIDEKVYQFHYHRFKSLIQSSTSIFTIKALEYNKSLRQLEKIFNFFELLNLEKHELCYIVGGGMVCDLGALACSLWKRGIRFVLIPTTVLAQADACIGGKTAINFHNTKNMVGTIADPWKILIDTIFLDTLPLPDIHAGLAEILKIALVMNANFWKTLINELPSTNHDTLTAHIYQAALMKQTLTTIDKKEYHLRHLLNFGHTIGHAIEGYYHKQKWNIRHGEAVAIGMMIESWLSIQVCGLDSQVLGDLKKCLKSLSLIPEKLDLERNILLKYIMQDKKSRNSHLQFSLLQSIGLAVFYQEISWELIETTIDLYPYAE